MNTRIYVVTTKATGGKRLVEASTPAQAIRHVANNMFECAPASARDVAAAMQAGATVESAGKEQQPELPLAEAAT